MLSQTETERRDGVEWLGELHPLMTQLGSADGLVTLGALSASLETPQVVSLAALAVFLRAYRTRILVPLEWPAICRACQHARRNELRELMALDRELASQPLLRPWAAASQRVGRAHLERLRPLHDERVVQRYLQAVRTNRAHGWHTLVYGMTLAAYSLPVRQGLISYARHTLRGFIQAAARPLRLEKEECHELLQSLCAELPRELEACARSCGFASR